MSDVLFRKDIEKSENEIVRTEISEFRSQKYLNIRAWYKEKDKNEFKPTMRGVALRLELYPHIKAAILGAEAKAQELLSD